MPHRPLRYNRGAMAGSGEPTTISLVPFSPAPAPAPTVTATLVATPDGLRARYRLRGDASALAIPAPAERPARRDGLWRSTCVELFVARAGERGYLEVNLSPSGDWNVYSFTGYREGMAPAAAVLTVLPARAGGSELELGFELALDGGGDRLELGVAAVIEHAGGALSYWAAAHPGERPDFHRRDGFVVGCSGG
jgi:hypothetical protein